MDQATVFNVLTREVSVMTAQAYAKMLIDQRVELGLFGDVLDIQLFHPQTGALLEFCPADPDRSLMPHFKAASGHSVSKQLPSLLDQNLFGEIRDTISRKGKILLDLQADLSCSSFDFRFAALNQLDTLERWSEQHHDESKHIAVSTAEDIVGVVKTIKLQNAALMNELGLTVADTVYVHHQGAVISHDLFFLPHNQGKMRRLYRELQAGENALFKKDTRSIGFPRLVEFVPTGTTKDMLNDSDEAPLPTTGNIRGNFFPKRSKYELKFCSQIVSTDSDQDEGGKESFFSEVWGVVAANRQGFYVLARPSVSIGKDADKGIWQYLRLAIHPDYVQEQTVAQNTVPVVPFNATVD